MPTWLRRWGYRVASKLLFAYSYVFRPSMRGVRCVLRRGDDVLLVRHTYGPREWGLPGGTMKRGESPATTARREMGEELGVDLNWQPIGELRFVGQDRARHHVYCFAADLPDGEVELNRAEIAEARWYPAASLPNEISRDTDTVLERARER